MFHSLIDYLQIFKKPSYLLPYQLQSPDVSSPNATCVFLMGHQLRAEEPKSFPLSPFSHVYYICISVWFCLSSNPPTLSFLLHVHIVIRIKGKTFSKDLSSACARKLYARTYKMLELRNFKYSRKR